MNFFGSDDGSDDGSSSLLDGVLNSATALGQTAILATQQPQVNTSYPYRPPVSYTGAGVFSPFGVGGSSSGSGGLLFFGVIVVALLFLFKR